MSIAEKKTETFKDVANSCQNYKAQLYHLDLQIEQINYILQGVSGIDNTKLHLENTSYSNEKSDMYYNLIDKKDYLLAKRNVLNQTIEWVKMIINKATLAYRPYIVAIYLRRERLSEVADKIEISTDRLSRILNSSTSRFG